MRTWTIELLVITLILGGVTLFFRAASPLEWLGCLAVLATFAHSQVADRLAEKEAAKTTPDVDCYPWLTFYWVTKELFWFVYFLLHQSYAALVGVIIFLIYPIWRRWYRRHQIRG